MSDKANIFRKLVTALAAVLGIGSAEAERAISIQRLYQGVWEALYRIDPEAWLTDIYQDGAAQYVVYASGGKLYRADLTQSGESVTLGAPVQVTEDHPPAARMNVIRQADGRARWFLQAGTATLDRMGEIDSTALFDTFVERARESGNYPLLDFFHEEGLVIGAADYVARDDYVYIASGVFDEASPIAQAVIRDSTLNPSYWGASITFHPDGEPEMVEIADGIKVPVYTAGTNTRIAILPETRACSWFTALVTEGVNRMKDETVKELERLLGAEAAASIVAQVDSTNRAITDSGMITREDAPAAEPAQDAPAAEVETPEAAPTAEMELDDSVIAAVAEKVGATYKALYDEMAATMAAGLAELKAALDAMTPVAETSTREIAALKERVDALAVDDEEKQRRWLEDQPKRGQVRATYRPRVENSGDERPATMAETAAATLSKIGGPSK